MNSSIIEHTQVEPRFSVISVCLNNLNGLKVTYDSVISQAFGDWEWIVVDGKSNDGTLEWLRAIKDSRLVFVSDKDAGLYDAMNKGIGLAKGDYVIFLNGGDAFANHDVLGETNKASENQPDFLYGDAFEKTLKNELLLKQARSHKYLWYGMFTHHQSMFFNRKRIGKMRHDLSMRIGSDYDFVCKFLVSNAHSVKLNNVVSIFSLGGISSTKWHIALLENYKTRRETLNLPVLVCVLIALVHISMVSIRKLLPNLYQFFRHSN